MTGKTIREMIKDIKAGTADLSHLEYGDATMDEVVGTQWTREDIKHYLATETDERRLVRWCRLFLKLEF